MPSGTRSALGVCNGHAIGALLILDYAIDEPELYGEDQTGAIPAPRIGSDCAVLVNALA